MPGMHSVLSRESIVSPSQFPALLWYDASDLSTITSSLNTVLTWSNKGTFYPAYSTLYSASYISNDLKTGSVTLNGKNVLSCSDSALAGAYFAPTDMTDYFGIDGGPAPLLGNTPHSIFLVIQEYRAPSENGYPIFFGDQFNSEIAADYRSLVLNPGDFTLHQKFDAISPGSFTDNGFTVPNFQIISWIYDGNTASVFNNGVLIDYFITGGVNTSYKGLWGLVAFVGNVAEIIVYDKVSNSLQSGTQSYLKRKWNL
jgi:hypothetical protein